VSIGCGIIHRLLPGGYGYLISITEKMAYLIVVVPKGRVDNERCFAKTWVLSQICCA